MIVLYAFAGVGFQAHDEFRELHFRRVCDEQVRVIFVGFHFLQLAFEAVAYFLEGVCRVTRGIVTMRRYLAMRMMCAPIVNHMPSLRQS